MALIDKEIIRPGTYWYRDQSNGQPRKLVVTPELTRYWHDQGNKMLSTGLTVPLPCEHDFDAHPMTPAEKLKNNAGWINGYKMKGDALYAALDVQDEDIAKRLPTTIRWTSPWINSFTDGKGTEWKNVISHLALTTRPRIVEQQPFGSVAAALSMAETVRTVDADDKGFFLSRAGRLNHEGVPEFPMAFSMMTGIAMGDFGKPKTPPKDDDTGDDMDFDDDDSGGGDDIEMDDDPTNNDTVDLGAPGPSEGDVSMVELLCDLLGALGIVVQQGGSEDSFKRDLYNATMTKIHELTNKGDGKDPNADPTKRQNPPGQPPNNPQNNGNGQQNPLIQQEQQPMYMSLDEIKKIPDPTMKSIALSMYNENAKLRKEMEADRKAANSLRDAKLKEENIKRQQRAAMIGRVSPRVKADLDAMLALPSMALSMGDGGEVIDPMAQTLAVLEKGLSDLPRLLTTDASALSVHEQPKDGDEMTAEQEDAISDDMARRMGIVEERKAS